MPKFSEVFQGTVEVTIRVKAAGDNMGYYGKTLAEVNRTRTGEQTWQEVAQSLKETVTEALTDAAQTLDHSEALLRKEQVS